MVLPDVPLQPLLQQLQLITGFEKVHVSLELTLLIALLVLVVDKCRRTRSVPPAVVSSEKGLRVLSAPSVPAELLEEGIDAVDFQREKVDTNGGFVVNGSVA